jgi:hypothetical protein
MEHVACMGGGTRNVYKILVDGGLGDKLIWGNIIKIYLKQGVRSELDPSGSEQCPITRSCQDTGWFRCVLEGQ